MYFHAGITFCVVFAAESFAGAQAPAHWKLEPIATIEGPSQADPFTTIRGLALHPDGRLVVSESGVKRVSMFDANGKSLGIVGRMGSGPGEYRDPYSVAWLADTLAIYDPGESRVAFLVNGIVPLRTERTLRLTGDFQVRFYPVSATRAYLFHSRRVGATSETVFVPFGQGNRDTIAVPTMPKLATGAICNVENGGIKFIAWPEAPRSIVFPVRPDGALAIGNTGEYNIMIRLQGRTVASLSRKDFAGAPLDDFMWNTENAEYRGQVGKFGAASCASAPVRPAHRSPIRAMAVADNGDIWITVLGKKEIAFDVFASDGRYIATVPAPVRGLTYIPIVIAGNRIAYVEDDRDGVQTVRLFRIVK